MIAYRLRIPSVRVHTCINSYSPAIMCAHKKLAKKKIVSILYYTVVKESLRFCGIASCVGFPTFHFPPRLKPMRVINLGELTVTGILGIVRIFVYIACFALAD